MGFTLSRKIFTKKITVAVKLTTSAMGKDHQTRCTSPDRLSSYATGSSTISWRHREVMVE